MKAYSVFVVVPEAERNNIKISDFTHEKVVEVLTFGESDITYDVAKMLRCHLIVTVGGWFSDENCNKAVQVARIMNKEVIHGSSFNSYVKEKYD